MKEAKKLGKKTEREKKKLEREGDEGKAGKKDN